MNKPRRRLMEEFEPGTPQVSDVTPEQTEQPQNISLDQRVDHFLVQYEKESQPDAFAMAIQEGLMKFLFEADEEAPMGDDFGGGDMPPPDLGGDAPSGEETTEPEKAPGPKINISNFASRLARLVNNYESLLDPKTVILNRAQTYIAQNYNHKVARELMVAMESFGLSPRRNKEKSNLDVPMATGAAGNMIGGGGGGGP